MKKEYQIIFHKIIIITQLQRNNSDLAAIKNFPLKTSYLYYAIYLDLLHLLCSD